MIPIQVGWPDHLVALGILAIMFAALLRRDTLKQNATRFDTQLRINTYLSTSLFLWVVAAVTVGVWLWQGRAITDLGLRNPWSESANWTIVLMAIFLAGFAIDTLLTIRNAEQRLKSARQALVVTPFMPTTLLELAWWSVLAASAGVCEEIAFRGYLIQYFIGWFGASPVSIGIAISLPAIVFGISHIYQGPIAALKIAGLSVIFGGIFVASQSIVLLMIVHFLLDALQGIISLLIIRELHQAERSNSP